MTKLSKPMQKVIDLMAAGWELCFYPGYTSYVYLQKDGCGKGGDVESFRFATLHAIRKRGLIKCVERRYPLNRYELTKAGKEAANVSDPTSS